MCVQGKSAPLLDTRKETYIVRARSLIRRGASEAVVVDGSVGSSEGGVHEDKVFAPSWAIGSVHVAATSRGCFRSLQRQISCMFRFTCKCYATSVHTVLQGIYWLDYRRF